MGFVVVFYVVLLLPGQKQPIDYHIEVDNYASCLQEAQRFADRLPDKALTEGAQIDIGCVITVPPSVEQ